MEDLGPITGKPGFYATRITIQLDFGSDHKFNSMGRPPSIEFAKEAIKSMEKQGIIYDGFMGEIINSH